MLDIISSANNWPAGLCVVIFLVYNETGSALHREDTGQSSYLDLRRADTFGLCLLTEETPTAELRETLISGELVLCCAVLGWNHFRFVWRKEN